jgi:hypothetical protein
VGKVGNPRHPVNQSEPHSNEGEYDAIDSAVNENVHKPGSISSQCGLLAASKSEYRNPKHETNSNDKKSKGGNSVAPEVLVIETFEFSDEQASFMKEACSNMSLFTF